MTTVVGKILERAVPYVLAILLTGCEHAPRKIALAPLMIELPKAIIDACRNAEGVKEEERVVHFWATLDKELWTDAGPEVKPVVFGPAFGPLRQLWIPMASGIPGAERAWLDFAHRATTRTNLTRLSAYQLELMRCYFRGNGPEELNKARITSAFEDLALSTHSKGEDYIKGIRRMGALSAWLDWAAFSDACLETGLILSHRDLDAWRLIRRLVLRSVLLDAHHDPVQSERNPTLLPPGLSRTGMEHIRRFSDELDENGVRSALLALQEIMTTNPSAYPANVPPPRK